MATHPTGGAAGLSRALRSGRLPAQSTPKAAAAMGPVALDDEPGAADGAAAVMGDGGGSAYLDAIFADLAGAGGGAPVMDEPASASASARAPTAAASELAAGTSANQSGAQVGPASALVSRARRYGEAAAAASGKAPPAQAADAAVDGLDVVAEDELPPTLRAAAHSASSANQTPPRWQRYGRSIEAAGSPDPLAPAGAAAAHRAGAASASPRRRFMEESERPEVITARKAMAAAKVCTPLVAAVSFHPGSLGRASEAQAKALADMLVAVHRFSQATAASAGAMAGAEVAQWLVTQFMASAASVIAQRWERDGSVDVQPMIGAMQQLLANPSPQLSEAILGASRDAYMEVAQTNDQETVTARLLASTSAAAWQLYDWVTHKDLALERHGSQPIAWFSWGYEVEEVVNKLLLRTLSECRALGLALESADLRTAHMQSSIRRMADLIGAEYVAQSVLAMQWIQEHGPGQVAQDREAISHAQFDAVLEHIYQWARTNFIRIENGAIRAVEQKFDEQPQSPLSGTAGSPRPAGQ